MQSVGRATRGAKERADEPERYAASNDDLIASGRDHLAAGSDFKLIGRLSIHAAQWPFAAFGTCYPIIGQVARCFVKFLFGILVAERVGGPKSRFSGSKTGVFVR